VSAVNHPLIHLLPAVFQRTLQDPTRPPDRMLLALLEVMTGLQNPDLEVLAELDTYFDRYQAPEAFVPLLASWLDLDWLFIRQPERLDAAAAREISPLEIGRLRELVAGATRFIRLRGTAAGLLDFMETATGVAGLAVDEHVPGRSFHLRLWVPGPGEPWRATLAHMLQVLKPAYSTAELFTAQDLTNYLVQEFKDLPALSVTTVRADEPRPCRINLRVVAPGSLDLDPGLREQVEERIDTLTPPGVTDPAVIFDAQAGVWQKTFREWHNL
jgi:phage tail-like protein